MFEQCTFVVRGGVPLVYPFEKAVVDQVRWNVISVHCPDVSNHLQRKKNVNFVMETVKTVQLQR